MIKLFSKNFDKKELIRYFNCNFNGKPLYSILFTFLVMEERLIQMLVDQNEISWKSIINDIVTTEGMDPWDINISLLVEKFIERLNKYRNIELKVSGKVLLAAAILLRIKSKRLVGEDLSEFDRLIASGEVSEGEFYDSLEQELAVGEKTAIEQNYELVPRTPQPRKRKVSVYDLVKALEKALEVKKRRFDRNPEIEMKLPERKMDISLAIKNLYDKIFGFFQQYKSKLTFSQLVPGSSKLDKIYTFIPLLHLSNQKKVELHQEQHFGEIEVRLFNGGNDDDKTRE